LQAQTNPTDLVVVDDQTLAVTANRLVPPALVDTSIVRNTAGYLPLATVEQATDDAAVRAVLLTRALRDKPGYVSWLRLHFREVQLHPSYGAVAFVRPTVVQ